MKLDSQVLLVLRSLLALLASIRCIICRQKQGPVDWNYSMLPTKEGDFVHYLCVKKIIPAADLGASDGLIRFLPRLFGLCWRCQLLSVPFRGPLCSCFARYFGWSSLVLRRREEGETLVGFPDCAECMLCLAG